MAFLQVDDENGGAPLPEPCIAYVLREVLNALVYLHSGRGSNFVRWMRAELRSEAPLLEWVSL